MQANVGKVDQLLRISLGLVLLVSVFFLTGPMRWIGLVGLVLLATGFFQFCPLYRLLGVNTCKLK